MIGLGVLPGARKPIQDTASKAGKPCSIIVGTSGVEANRLVPVEAINLTLPCLANWVMFPGTRNAASTCPPMRSTTAGPAPLYGTCVMSTDAADLSISIVRCDALPVETDA